MKKRSLKFKMIIGGTLAVVIPVLFIGTLSIVKTYGTFINQGKHQIQQIAKDLSNMVEISIEQELKLAGQMAITPVVINAAAKVLESGIAQAQAEVSALDDFFVTLYQQIGKGYDIMFVLDTDGSVISDSTGGTHRVKGTSVAARDYFQEAKMGKISIGSPARSKSSGNPVFLSQCL